jgi:hypothetical protein
MALSEAEIAECTDDAELFELLGLELTELFPDGEGDTDAELDAFVARLATLPVGLRAMASIYQLDISLAQDDLGWHFANWHHKGYCDETLRGLRELEAQEAADIFEAAYRHAQKHWDKIGELVARDLDAFAAWYPDSTFEEATMPLTRQLWEMYGEGSGRENGLLDLWVPYARKWPGRVAGVSAS